MIFEISSYFVILSEVLKGGGRVQKVGRIYKSGWGKLKLKINKNGVKYVYSVFKYKYKLFPT